VKADHEIERSIEAELADLRQQLAAANCRITELEAVKDRRKSAAALADTQEQIELIVDTLPVLLAYIDAEQHYLYANRLYADWHGLAREEIIGKHVRDVLHETTYQKALPVIEAALRGQRVTYENDAAYDVQGQLHTVRATYVPQLDENEQVKAFLAMVEDITERKQAEERVKHLNAVLRAVRNVNQLIVREKDRGRLLQDVCDTLVETRGYYNAWIALLDESGALEAAAEAGLEEDFPLLVERLERGESTYCVRRTLAQAGILAIENPPSTCIDCPLSNKYGGRGGMATRIEHAGEVYGLLVVSTPGETLADEEEQGLFEEVARDIALALHDMESEEARQQAEETLRESEARYRELVQNANSAIIRWRRDGTITFFNEYAQAFFGYSADEIIGKDVNILVPEKESTGDDLTTLVRDIVNHPERYVNNINENICRDGRRVWMAWTNKPIRDKNGQDTEILAVGTDITERKRAEAQLAEQLDELRRWHAATLGREARVLDLKREVNELLAQAGQPPRYPSAEAEGQ
jgi:PAS domain S-box-containing protein